MTEKPILFSGPMVRAILDGRKTQTRRVCKLQPQIVDVEPKYQKNTWGFWHDDEYPNGKVVTCPYGQPGDRLWVRETWADPEGIGERILYRADMSDEDNALEAAIRKNCHELANAYPNGRWKPSIHMSRKYCRLLLDVKAVRVKRLQDISDNDIHAEGVVPVGAKRYASDYFVPLWESINEKRGYGWETNPWVWVIEFEYTP